MTGSLRVLLIGRRFWPQGSTDSGGHLFQLACELKRRGVAVEVLTPRYSTSWPVNLSIREIPVHRPVMAPKRDWSMGRYTRSMTAWLRRHASAYDVLFCDSIREESAAAVEAARSSRCAVVLRVSQWGQHSDLQWWATSRAARRCGSIAKLADAVIVKSAACQRGLLSDGFAADTLHRIEPGFAAGPLRSTTAKLSARAVLAMANSDLVSDRDWPVLVCPSSMTRESGVNSLVRAARHLIARYPDLRLWLLGDGPHRDWIYDTLRGDGVRGSIAMPGSFCDVEDILAAADVFFQCDDDGLEFWLPSAIAAELPIVAVDSESIRARLGDLGSHPSAGDIGSMLTWCPIDGTSGATPKAVRIAVRSVLDDLPSAFDRAAQLRRLLLRTRPQSDSIDAYLKLMQQVVSRRIGGRRSPSIEALG